MFGLSKKKSSITIFIVLVIVLIVANVFFGNEEKVKIIKEDNVWPIHNVIGYSVEGRKIESYTYGNGPTRLLFVGGIHGGYEWNSVYLAYSIIDYLKERPEIISNKITIDIIPSINPDGLHRVTGKESRFSLSDVSTDEKVLASGRFNANNVDLNRNFDCKWKPESMWRSKVVSAGTKTFSEPEAQTIKNFIFKNNPSAVVFWHSKSNAVYASQCEGGILPETINIMNVYSQASGYQAIKTFDAYEVTGAVEDWLSSIKIPSITVELKTHEDVELEKNLAGTKALIEYYGK